MAIVKMKRLRLLAMGADREKLLRLLQGMGCVEVDQADLDGEGASPELLEQLRDKVSRPDDRSLARAREGQSQAQRALAALDQFAPAKGNFLSPRPQVSQAELFDGPAALEARQAAREINDLDGRLGAIRTEEQKRTAQRAALAPWLPLDLPLETESTGQVAVQLGTLPAGVSLEEARAALKGTEGLADLSQVSADNTLRFCLLLCHNSRAEEALEALKELGWTRSSLREWTGTAAENDARLADELAAPGPGEGGGPEEAVRHGRPAARPEAAVRPGGRGGQPGGVRGGACWNSARSSCWRAGCRRTAGPTWSGPWTRTPAPGRCRTRPRRSTPRCRWSCGTTPSPAP